MIDQKGKLFGIINIIDLCVVILAVGFIFGLVLVKSGTHKTSATVVQE